MKVMDLAIDILPRLKGLEVKTSLFSAVNAATGAIFEKLKADGSDLAQENISISVKAGEDAETPSTFRGLVEDPLVSGQPCVMTPLLARDRPTARLLAAGTPKKYELLGRNLILYPKPAVACDVLCRIYCKPAQIDGLNDWLHYAGIADDIYRDAVTHVLLEGLSVVVSPTFAAIIANLEITGGKRHGRKPRRTRGYYY